MTCSRQSETEKLAAALVKGAAMELYLTPKPGLVDLADSGSHPDLSVAIMERSIGYVSGYLDEIVGSLAHDEPFESQRKIGIRAERCLLDKLGTNTHKGFIFLSGMLVIAHWHSSAPEEGAVPDEGAMRATLSAMAADFFRTTDPGMTNGRRARDDFHACGIVGESVRGFPSLFEHALPAFRRDFELRGCVSSASFAMLARLMQVVDDTTTLHRSGPAGLARVKADGRELGVRVAAGGEYKPFLGELNRQYVASNITIGGVADMLGLAFGLLIANGEIPAEATETSDVFRHRRVA
jgi:triphosphoribosyl-dephospho-CoA synthase